VIEKKNRDREEMKKRRKNSCISLFEYVALKMRNLTSVIVSLGIYPSAKKKEILMKI
jgi:hypothetical protein